MYGVRRFHSAPPLARLWVRPRLAPRRADPKEYEELRRVVAPPRTQTGDVVVKPPIGRALGFVGSVAAVSFLGCAAWSVSKTECLAQNPSARFFAPITSMFADQYDTQRLSDAAEDDLVAQANRRLAWLARNTKFLPEIVRSPILRMSMSAAEWYADQPAYKRAAVPVVALNAGVFLAWLAAPRLGTAAWMQRCMTHRPSSGRVVTLLTSVFSHKAAGHFLFNNLALWSVGGSALSTLALQQAWESRNASVPDASPLPQFLAFFVTAGAFASLTSHLVTAGRWRMAVQRIKDASRMLHRAASSQRPQLGAQIRAATAELMQLAQRASLGASGAIYAAFVLSACAYPQASLSIIFLPFTAIPIQWGMAGCVLRLTQTGPGRHPGHRARLAPL